MEQAIIIIGSISIWVWLASKVKNLWLKQYMFLSSVILVTGSSWVAWLALEQTELIAINLWRYAYLIVFTGWLLLWAGLWITGSLEKEEIDNGF